MLKRKPTSMRASNNAKFSSKRLRIFIPSNLRKPGTQVPYLESAQRQREFLILIAPARRSFLSCPWPGFAGSRRLHPISVQHVTVPHFPCVQTLDHPASRTKAHSLQHDRSCFHENCIVIDSMFSSLG